MGGWGPFQPVVDADAVAQHVKDVQQATDALTKTKAISDFATNQWHEDEITLGRIQRMAPESVNSTERDKLEFERNVAEHIVNDVAFAYSGGVAGWIIGIQSLRSIEKRKPGTIQPPSRLVMPEIPQELTDYAAANGL